MNGKILVYFLYGGITGTYSNENLKNPQGFLKKTTYYSEEIKDYMQADENIKPAAVEKEKEGLEQIEIQEKEKESVHKDFMEVLETEVTENKISKNNKSYDSFDNNSPLNTSFIIDRENINDKNDIKSILDKIKETDLKKNNDFTVDISCMPKNWPNSILNIPLIPHERSKNCMPGREPIITQGEISQDELTQDELDSRLAQELQKKFDMESHLQKASANPPSLFLIKKALEEPEYDKLTEEEILFYQRKIENDGKSTLNESSKNKGESMEKSLSVEATTLESLPYKNLENEDDIDFDIDFNRSGMGLNDDYWLEPKENIRANIRENREEGMYSPTSEKRIDRDFFDDKSENVNMSEISLESQNLLWESIMQENKRKDLLFTKEQELFLHEATNEEEYNNLLIYFLECNEALRTESKKLPENSNVNKIEFITKDEENENKILIKDLLDTMDKPRTNEKIEIETHIPLIVVDIKKKIELNIIELQKELSKIDLKNSDNLYEDVVRQSNLENKINELQNELSSLLYFETHPFVINPRNKMDEIEEFDVKEDKRPHEEECRNANLIETETFEKMEKVEEALTVKEKITGKNTPIIEDEVEIKVASSEVTNETSSQEVRL
jgi:hypothetical protein